MPPTCGNADGSITLTFADADGTEPYTFDWDIDGVGDNDDDQNQTGLATNIYTVTITNSEGCSSVETYSLSPEVAAPTASFVTTNPTCGLSNGSIDMTISGGAPPYTIDWDNDGTSDNDDAEDLLDIAEGTYNVTITDSGGCQTVASKTLTSSELPELNAIVSPESCDENDGHIDLSISGIAPFLIDWDNNGLGDENDAEDQTNLNAGLYNITVTDDNECSVTANFTVTVQLPPSLTIENVACNATLTTYTVDFSSNATITSLSLIHI